MDDETVQIREVDFGAELGADAAPALELIGSGRAVGHAASLVVVMHACGARRVTPRGGAAAQALGVAAFAVCSARSPYALLWALWWEKRGNVEYHRAGHCAGYAEKELFPQAAPIFCVGGGHIPTIIHTPLQYNAYTRINCYFTTNSSLILTECCQSYRISEGDRAESSLLTGYGV